MIKSFKKGMEATNSQELKDKLIENFKKELND